MIESLEMRRFFAAGPLVITHGGTYTGNYASDDPNVAVITIKTTDPVVIAGATLSGPGDLIETAVFHTNVTVRDTSGYGTNPNVWGEAKGRFFDAEMFDNVVLQNNYLDGTGGIYLLSYGGDHTSADTIKITGNRARNIDGRRSNGIGGYLNFNIRTSKSDGHTDVGYNEVQFVQLDKVNSVPGIDISWNEVINKAGVSRVEDNISIYKSSGTSKSPILIHDNYIQGAYTIKPAQKSTSDADWTYDWSYTGGGILLGDGLGDSIAEDPASVRAYNNQVVSTTNYGIAISAGHDLVFHDNRIVSSGMTSDGKAIAAQNTGAYVWDSNETGPTRFYKNYAANNTIGWNLGDDRSDWWIPDSRNNFGNTHWDGTITAKTEADEYAVWLKKMYAQFPERVPKLSIAGKVFNDTNGNGIRDGNESGLAGFRVFLDLDGDGMWDKGEPFTRSSSSGRYEFFDLRAGSYTVRVTAVSGYQLTTSSAWRVKTSKTSTVTRYFGAKQIA